MANRMIYEGGEVTVQWIGVRLATIIDAQERSFTVPISRLKPVKALASAPHTRTRTEREKEPLLTKAFIRHLQLTGVDIRIFCAEEHVEWLESALGSVGKTLPTDFEISATHSRGGVTRPQSFGIECTFEVPGFDVPTKFRARADRTASIARTEFGLHLLRAEFPLTSWKGKKSIVEVPLCQEVNL